MANLTEEKKDPLGLLRLPSTDKLNGKSFLLNLTDGGKMTVSFDAETAAFRCEGTDFPASGKGSSNVVELREDIFFTDIDLEEPSSDGVSIFLMLTTGWALAIHQRRVAPDNLWDRGPDCHMWYKAAAIDGYTQTGDAPAPTKDLMGARDFVQMGPENFYEHIYISHEKMVVHHVHTNLARGKAEVQHTDYYKLADKLYAVCVQEMDNGVGLVQANDYETMRMTGKAHHALSRWESVARFMGGMILPVNGKLEYPMGLEPTGFIRDGE